MSSKVKVDHEERRITAVGNLTLNPFRVDKVMENPCLKPDEYSVQPWFRRQLATQKTTLLNIAAAPLLKEMGF